MCHTWSLALLRATQASASRVTVVVSCSTGQLLWSAGSSASRVTVVVSYSTGQLLWSAASAGSSASRVTAGSCRGHCWFTQGSLPSASHRIRWDIMHAAHRDSCLSSFRHSPQESRRLNLFEEMLHFPVPLQAPNPCSQTPNVARPR